MNSSYPENTADYDEQFIYKLAVATFSVKEIHGFLKTNYLNSFDRHKLHFVKSKAYLKNKVCNALLKFAGILSAIYGERVKEDKKRFNAFRKLLKTSLESIITKKTKK